MMQMTEIHNYLHYCYFKIAERKFKYKRHFLNLKNGKNWRHTDTKNFKTKTIKNSKEIIF